MADVDGSLFGWFIGTMFGSLTILIGGITVLVLFVGQIWLLGMLNDKLNVRAEAIEAANPGQANVKAERLVRRLGKGALQCVRATVWLIGLMVLPALILIVYEGAWTRLPLVFALTLGISLIEGWSSRTLNALDGGP